MEASDTQYGLYVNMSECTVIEVAAYAGFDFVRIDLEHSLIDYSALENLIRTANLLHMPVQVRVSSLTEITRILDCGADGIVVPDVNSAKRAQQAVEMCKYAPLGKRGMYPPCRGNRLGIDSFERYLAASNKRTSLIIQIEDQEAIDNIDAILTVPGIDMVATGKADLSQSLGVPGRIADGQVIEAENKIIKKALAYHKQTTILSSSPLRTQQLLHMGVRHIILGPDISLLYKGFVTALNELKTK